MRNLNEILTGVNVISVSGKTDLQLNAVTSDSRKITAGDVFVAVKGYLSGVHTFIKSAIEKGAVAIIAEQMPNKISEKITYILVKVSAKAYGIICHNYFDAPTTKLKLIGITGTNGKTSVATICYQVCENIGIHSGLISTVENKIHNTAIYATHTTPDPLQLNALLAEMVKAKYEYVFMEVSSHAAHQQRIAGLQFAGAVFTNITHDHLDYHATFDNYIAAKKSFFDGLSKQAFALVNADDKRSGVMVQNSAAHKYTFAVKTNADFIAKILENNLSGLVLQIDGMELHTRLAGAFNAWNILAVYGVLQLLELNKQEVLNALSLLSPVEGRFDIVHSVSKNLTGVIDYAHTPDAVEKILSTIREAVKNRSKIITVIGCGGDRDKTKRPVMANVAAKISDKVILTSDNPRSEEPEIIIREMQQGLDNVLMQKALSITDRKEAIRAAVMLAQNDDVILVAGKGHEKYQEIKGVKYPFDDKQIIQEIFKTLNY
ncbi:MAG: UDP-N-acetylmuramoyl-L-alanyl-D-glutamate--2,6-diaminopimelate ligase [Bacteroidetes bacterium]|nr:UDP-N-acetylmuramoyl-L-alanyl-D-glutamate--2,6-diaminopimelate ligase [Bacteroidota bacterium]